MSHLSAQMSGNDSDDDWDEGNVANLISIIPGSNASKGDLMDALKAMQLEIQRLRDDNRTLKENNKMHLLLMSKLFHCMLSKYGMTVEMFPNSELIMKKCLDLRTLFNSIDCYKTSATQESAFLDELYTHFPERIHDCSNGKYVLQRPRMLYFAFCAVNKCITDARSNEIKKLRGVAGDIFNLPGKYFANANYDRAGITDIQKMLGIFPPLLFPGLQEDATLKTVFGNWTLVAKILRASLHGVTSLHQEPCGGSKTNSSVSGASNKSHQGLLRGLQLSLYFCSHQTLSFQVQGVGKSSTLNYKDLFFQYKKLLIVKWGTKRIKTIVTNINNHVFGGAKSPSTLESAGAEDFSDEINRAMLALDMETDSEEDAPPLSLMPSAVQVLLAPSVPSVPPVFSAPPAAPPVLSAPEGPNLDIQPTNMEESASLCCCSC
ncbi:hypothetical protein F4604DRAFT_1915604 [Suillus subluteus]|nr:hypothetical protein F4604DRAFT_1915604 [Suillus subluteus]